ncbi:hypothetical protein D3C86_1934910 [compost metagenome]
MTGLVALDGLQQADGADLDQVLDGVGATTGETPRDLLDQRQVVFDDLLFLLGGGSLESLFHRASSASSKRVPTVARAL